MITQFSTSSSAEMSVILFISFLHFNVECSILASLSFTHLVASNARQNSLLDKIRDAFLDTNGNRKGPGIHMPS